MKNDDSISVTLVNETPHAVQFSRVTNLAIGNHVLTVTCCCLSETQDSGLSGSEVKE